MHRNMVKALSLVAAPLLFAGTTAWGGDGVEVNVTNDGTDALMVTIYDTSAGPNAVVLSHTRINGFTSVAVSVSPGATGRANLSWTAVSADAQSRKCGHEDNVDVSDSSSLTVKADSSCNISS